MAIPPTFTMRRRQHTRAGFTIVEVLVVIAIIGVLISLLLPAVQRARESAARLACQNNLKQLGLALHGFAGTAGYLPAGMVTELDIQDSFHTAFTYLLPHVEQSVIQNQIQFDKPWYDQMNYLAVGQQVPIFYCPSNRLNGQMDLGPVIQQWNFAMPPAPGACDYVLCKGANAGTWYDPGRMPPQVRGLFQVSQADSTVDASGQQAWLKTPQFRIRLIDIRDGLSSTIAIGEGAGGNPWYLVGDLKNPGQPVLEPFVNGPAVMEQAWGAASLGDAQHPWYASVFGVTAQFGMPPNLKDEPMNRRPGTPTIFGSDSSGYNLSGRDSVSGFRSMHTGGCNFVFADGSVHWLQQSIDPAIYRALSTYAGGEVVSAFE